jgi:hypothetical protein
MLLPNTPGRTARGAAARLPRPIIGQGLPYARGLVSGLR